MELHLLGQVPYFQDVPHFLTSDLYKGSVFLVKGFSEREIFEHSILILFLGRANVFDLKLKAGVSIPVIFFEHEGDIE